MAIFNTVYGGEPKWKPWTNTLAYFPFENDQLDHSGNWVNISWTGTKDTIWYTFTANATVSVSNVKWFCTWVKLNSASWNSWHWTFYDAMSMWWYLWNRSVSDAEIWTFYTSSYAKASKSLSDVYNWHLLWVWYDGTNTVYWVDGEYWTLRSWSWYNFGSSFYIHWVNRWTYDCSYSKFIIESDARTQQEWTDYYNQTKWLYS